MKAKSVVQVILNHLQYFPSTCSEVEAYYKYKHQTASPRFNELRNAGYIEPTGEVRDGSVVYKTVEGVEFKGIKRAKKQQPTLLNSPKSKLDNLVRNGFISSYSTSDKVEGDRLLLKFPDGSDLEFRP